MLLISWLRTRPFTSLGLSNFINFLATLAGGWLITEAAFGLSFGSLTVCR
jgi:hypothetical protein